MESKWKERPFSIPPWSFFRLCTQVDFCIVLPGKQHLPITPFQSELADKKSQMHSARKMSTEDSRALEFSFFWLKEVTDGCVFFIPS